MAPPQRGIGLDVVDIGRIARVLARSPAFAERYFTAAERRACASSPVPARAYAERFAVKEALLKALGHGVLGPIPLRAIEVTAHGRTVELTLSREAAAATGPGARVRASVASDDRRAWATVVVDSVG